MQTRCMAACIGHIRLQGLIEMSKEGVWKENLQSPLYYLIHVAKVALPLYPQFGTEPNGYYIPPRWVPRPYLKQMFGPAWMLPSKYSAPIASCWRCCNSSAKTPHLLRYEIRKVPRFSSGCAASSNSATIPSLVTPKTALKSSNHRRRTAPSDLINMPTPSKMRKPKTRSRPRSVGSSIENRVVLCWQLGQCPQFAPAGRARPWQAIWTLGSVAVVN